VRFDAIAPDVDETPLAGEAPGDYVDRLARAKAQAVRAVVEPEAVVLAADTTVALGTELFGKPVDVADARRMLLALAGTTHAVHTGVAVDTAMLCRGAVVTTRVEFAEVDQADLEWYLATGEPLDRAGAYAIQGGAAHFVQSVDGSPSNVIGLPMTTVADLLEAVGHPLASFRPHAHQEER
jgi:septum formation protein